MLLAYVAFLLNIGDMGECQYGPRYMLTGMPFAALGLIGYSYLPSSRLKSAAVGLLVVVGVFSAIVNVVGAMGGSMYCQIDVYAFPRYLSRFAEGKVPEFPLAGWLILPCLACAAAFLGSYTGWGGGSPRAATPPLRSARPA
jgi:hypothetical protein